MTDLPEKWKWREVEMTAAKPSEEWLTARIETMLSLFYRPDLSEAIDLASSVVWSDVLRGLPQEVIDQACCEWERNEEKRPTPAGIRKRALAGIVSPKPPPEDDDQPFGEVVAEDELERRRKMQAKIRREFPMLKRMTKMEGD